VVAAFAIFNANLRREVAVVRTTTVTPS